MGEIYWFVWLLTAVVEAANKVERPGNHIVVGCYEAKPLLMSELDANGTRILTGTVVGQLDYLFSASQNLSYSLVVTDTKEVAKYGQGVAAFNQVANKEVDLVVTGHIITNERLKVSDHVYPHYFANYQFLQPYPKQQSRLLAAIKPFQPGVWLWFTLSFFAVILVLAAMALYEQRMNPAEEQKTFWELFGSNAIYVFTVLVGQGNFVSSPKLFIRILAGIWCLMTVVVAYSFSGNLTSFLTTPVYKPVVNTFDDLAQSKTLKLTIEGNNILGQTMMKATSGVYKTFADSLRAHPENYAFTRPDLEKRIFSYETAYLGVEILIMPLVDLDWKKHNKKECGLTVGKKLPLGAWFAFMLQKDSPWNKFVNDRMFRYVESGVNDKLAYKLIDVRQCLVENAPKSKGAPLKLQDLSVAFIVLGVGSGLAFFVFICENIARLRSKRNKVSKVPMAIEAQE